MTRTEWTAEEAQAMDRWLVEERGRTIPELMAVAGRRVAEAAREMLAGRGLRSVVALVGPGNNGGDVLVALQHLPDVETDIWRPLDGDPVPRLDAGTLVIDGLFGVGLARPIAGAARRAVLAVRGSPAAVLAVDVPSGLSATTGGIVGCTAEAPDGGVAIRADRTVTFVGAKRGFFRGEGPRLVGDWRAVDIGFPVAEAEAWLARRRAGAGAG
jgi:NAD(P)H-hydrate repair Nnr-like enzyme with NAD(P)H-hydrate epimerase domain